jgi:Flp pilus assembly CpaE family ATPase
MDAWVVSDSDFLATRICDALNRHGVSCPPSRVNRWDRADLDLSSLSGLRGAVFIGAARIDDGMLDVVRRLRAAVDAEARLIVIAAGSDHGAILKSVRAGASDVLDAQGSLDDEIADFVSRDQLASRETNARGRVLTIVPCQAPSDADFLAANMSAVIAAHTTVCGVLDLHFRGGDLPILLKMEPRHTILDLLTQAETIDDTMFRQALTKHDAGVQLLAAPEPLSDLSSIGASGCQQIIGLAKQCWPVLIVNAEDMQHAEQLRALAHSQDVVLTMRLDVASLHRTQKHIEFLTRNQFSLERVHVVAMGTGHVGELPASAAKNLLKTPHLHCIPDDPSAAIMSINLGNPLVLERPNSKPAAAIVKLTKSIMGLSAGSSAADTRRTASTIKAAALAACTLPFYR